MTIATIMMNGLVGGVLSVTLASPVLATPPADHGVDQSLERGGDEEFVRRAVDSGQQEVETGKVAVRQGASAEVRAFADRMVEDHTIVNAELLGLASAPPPPVVPDPVGSTTRTLAAQTGPDFDRAYMEHSVTNHELVVALFEREAADGKNERLKLWAEQKLRTLREHLEMARRLRAKVAAGSAQ